MTPNELLDFLHKKAGFCGCGQPNEAFEMLRDTLVLINELKVVVWSSPDRSLARNDWNRRFSELIGSKDRTGLACWWLYWIDHIGLTEHGGSVPGWLTPLGEKVMEAMIAVGETDEDVDQFLNGEG